VEAGWFKLIRVQRQLFRVADSSLYMTVSRLSKLSCA
jgi:hypothetical protein